ncbi:hypothetical protein [Riemerella anatipestifer]|uniref:hypothetical protein n=1 Tax=Riemerella anatipestifer TaxID=34085 RepID=UPI001372B1E0|nr:hypothetical protein [Riemerella anatipestifer]MBT0550230.1 hypothetical protein [Riemerella anatipestifer]MBT0556954.1 hypothetical protein [Riemerella anatipestifer]MBT0560990.1 hypothetical protein [Riemerella anatipestifer]NAV17339.1 hypothetical protein [Riemerella anatipestifer]
MRKFFIYLTTGLLMISCSDVINKKPNLETAKEDIATIKEKYKDDYSPADFEALSDKLAGNVMKSVFAKGENAVKEGISFDKTYKEYLDEIKEERVKKEKELAELKAAVAVEVLDASIERGSGIMADYDVNLPVKVKIKNTSGKAIQGISGRIEAIDMFDKNIDNLKFEITDEVKPNAELVEDYIYDISFGDLKKMDESSFSKLKFVWVPQTIIFKDGSRLPKVDK